MMRHQTRIPYILIVVLYIAVTVLVDPRGEFPLNDDWTYTRSALQFGNGNRMHIDEWSAPSVVGQALYGGLLIKLFGMRFLLLRLSTLIASCAISLGLWFALEQLGVDGGMRWIAVLAWIFNPLQFSLSFTYMTEVPFLFCIALTVILYLLYLSRRKPWILVAIGWVLGYAYLIRQTSALFLAALMIALVLDGAEAWRQRITRVMLLASNAAVLICGYHLWLQAQGGATPATRRKFELLHYLTVEQLAGNWFGLVFYMAFLLIPLWVALLPVLRPGRGSGLKAWFACLAGWLAVSASGLWWFHAHYSHRPYLPSKPFHARMPFLLNVIYDTGLGPVTLDPAYFGQSQLPTYPRVWLAITVVTALAVVIPGMLFTFVLVRRLLAEKTGKAVLIFPVLSFAFIAGFETVFSHLQEGGLFDRHLVIAAFPLCIAACVVGFRTGRAPGPERACRIAAFAAIFIMAAFSVGGTHDYLAWNRARWNLGNEAIASGIKPLDMSAGFEFNAWHNYETFQNRGHVEKVYQWWYDMRNYLITMQPEPGYRTVGRRDFFSWIHRRRVPLLLVEKCGGPCGGQNVRH